MPEERKAYLPYVVSGIAVVMSGIALYMDFFQPVGLDFYVSRHAYISNARGGIPDINLKLSVQGSGPSRKSIALDSVKVILRNLNAKTDHELVSSPRYDKLPTILNGGDVTTLEPLLIVKYSLSETVRLYDNWCDELIRILPNETKEIEKIRSSLKRKFIPVSAKNGIDNAKNINTNTITIGDAMSNRIENPLDQISELLKLDDDSLDESIAQVLKKVPTEHLDRIVFFTSGNYEVEFSPIAPSGKSFGTKKYKFSIDNVMSEALIHNFNTNTFLTMEEVLH